MSRLPIAVVGAGAAGITCAVQLARVGLCPLLFERARPGGAIRRAWRVENLPVLEPGVSGAAIAERLENQLDHFAIETIHADISHITCGETFTLFHDNRSHSAAAVVLACGLIDIPFEAPQALAPFFYRDIERLPPGATRVLVLGGGDVAFDQAGRLAEQGTHVTLICRNARPRALARIVQAAKERGVQVHLGCEPNWDERDGRIAAFEDGDGFDAVLTCIGRRPAPPVVEKDGEALPLAAITAAGETGQAGLFVAGDLQNGPDRQLSLAMGDGMRAALELIRRFG